MKKLPDVGYLYECFYLVGGDLIWKLRPREHFPTDRGWATFNGKNAGKKAGSLNSSTGHIVLTLNAEKVMASRIIMKMFFKIESTSLYIVHRDGNRLNNDPRNLCLENKGTMLACRKSPKITRGVNWSPSMMKWVVKVGDARNPRFTAYYEDIDEACAAASVLREKYYGTYKGVR